MSYTELMSALTNKRAQEVMSMFVQRYAELFVSIDESSTIERMLSFARLHSELFNIPATDGEVLLCYGQILGYLLKTGVVVPAEYGFSAKGEAQSNYLLSLVGGPEPDVEAAPQVNPVIAEYAAFEKSASAKSFRDRLVRDKGFAAYVESLPAKPVADFYS